MNREKRDERREYLKNVKFKPVSKENKDKAVAKATRIVKG